jgi:hypothetical protein
LILWTGKNQQSPSQTAVTNESVSWPAIKGLPLGNWSSRGQR